MDDTAAQLKALSKLTQEEAKAAIKRIRDGGLVGDVMYKPAVVIPITDCILAQPTDPEWNGGYMTIKVKSGCSDFVHRVLVVAKGKTHVKALMQAGNDASHRCHNVLCLNPDHIEVETHAENAARKICSSRLMYLVQIEDQDYIVAPPECAHKPECIPRFVELDCERVLSDQMRAKVAALREYQAELGRSPSKVQVTRKGKSATESEWSTDEEGR